MGTFDARILEQIHIIGPMILKSTLPSHLKIQIFTRNIKAILNDILEINFVDFHEDVELNHRSMIEFMNPNFAAVMRSTHAEKKKQKQLGEKRKLQTIGHLRELLDGLSTAIPEKRAMPTSLPNENRSLRNLISIPENAVCNRHNVQNLPKESVNLRNKVHSLQHQFYKNPQDSQNQFPSFQNNYQNRLNEVHCAQYIQNHIVELQDRVKKLEGTVHDLSHWTPPQDSAPRQSRGQFVAPEMQARSQLSEAMLLVQHSIFGPSNMLNLLNDSVTTNKAEIEKSLKRLGESQFDKIWAFSAELRSLCNLVMLDKHYSQVSNNSNVNIRMVQMLEGEEIWIEDTHRAPENSCVGDLNRVSSILQDRQWKLRPAFVESWDNETLSVFLTYTFGGRQPNEAGCTKWDFPLVPTELEDPAAHPLDMVLVRGGTSATRGWVRAVRVTVPWATPMAPVQNGGSLTKISWAILAVKSREYQLELEEAAQRAKGISREMLMEVERCVVPHKKFGR